MNENKFHITAQTTSRQDSRSSHRLRPKTTQSKLSPARLQYQLTTGRCFRRAIITRCAGNSTWGSLYHSGISYLSVSSIVLKGETTVMSISLDINIEFLLQRDAECSRKYPSKVSWRFTDNLRSPKWRKGDGSVHHAYPPEEVRCW